jgi:hypothetical protein
MLRRTRRLRTALRTNMYRVESHYDPQFLSRMREVEFTCCDGGFPDGFRWETFVSYFSDKTGPDVVLYSSNMWNRGPSPPSTRVRRFAWNLCCNHKFDVLWLTPRVFIARRRFSIDYNALYDYIVRLDGRTSSDFYVYQLFSILDPRVHLSPPSVPFAFLCHLMEFLDADYFDRICLELPPNWPLPPALYEQFLSIIPHKARPMTTENRCATFQLRGLATRATLRQILAHQFHPEAKFDFDLHCHFLDAASVDEFSHLVRESKYIRTVAVTSHYTPDHVAADGLFITGAVFKSPLLTIRYRGLLPAGMLHSIATFHDTVNLSIYGRISTQSSFGYVTDIQKRLLKDTVPYLQPFFHESSAVERLHIGIYGGCLESRFGPTEFTACTSRKLSCLLVVLHRVERWDSLLFPAITLNCYRNRLKKNMDRGILPLAIKAVIEGNVYHRTTNHEAFDMRIANAGLILCILRG